MTLADLRAVIRARRADRQRRRRLRRDLLEYRSSAERHELQAILLRYDTTMEELLTGHDEMRRPEPEERPTGKADWELDLDN